MKKCVELFSTRNKTHTNQRKNPRNNPRTCSRTCFWPWSSNSVWGLYVSGDVVRFGFQALCMTACKHCYSPVRTSFTLEPLIVPIWAWRQQDEKQSKDLCVQDAMSRHTNSVAMRFSALSTLVCESCLPMKCLRNVA